MPIMTASFLLSDKVLCIVEWQNISIHVLIFCIFINFHFALEAEMMAAWLGD